MREGVALIFHPVFLKERVVMEFNVLINSKKKTIGRAELKQVIGSYLPEWSVDSVLSHMIDNYYNSDEGYFIRLDELSESYSPYEVIDYEEAVYRCSSMIDDEDEDEDQIIDIIEEWLEGYLDTHTTKYGSEFLVFSC